MGTRLQRQMGNGWLVTAVILLAVTVLVIAAVVATMQVTGARLSDACWAVGPSVGWGGLTFACGWWIALRKRERVGAEVALVLAPLLKELKHLRATIAQRGVDESTKTSVHPRRLASASDDAATVVASYHRVREAVR